VFSFSADIFSGIVMIILYLLAAAAIARPIPVLPDVGSMRMSPGLHLPYFSASSTILLPILSLTEPPGLRYSHLTSTSHLIPSA